jgi:hypothetical protein
MPTLPNRFARPRPTARVLLWVALATVTCSVPAAAQVIRPWSPPGDSLSPQASRARMHFQKQSGDSVSGDNYSAFELVGNLGRRLFASLGKEHLGQAGVAQQTLDSLGLDVEIATDPATTHIVFMLVRNPFRPSSDAVGYLYWMRGNELRMQGASFPPSRRPRLRTWFTGRQNTPYEAAVLFDNLRDHGRVTLDLFRMDPGGSYWDLVQYPGHGPEMLPGAQATFADVNLDGQPEIVAFQRVDPDSYLVIKSGVLPTLQELTWTERPEGFVLHDIRPVPGPTETLRLFTQLLVERQVERAKRLVLRPVAVDSMVQLGWGRHAEAGAWTVEYAEPMQPWPEWVEVRARQDSGWKHWIVHFWIQDGRWVIRDWIPVVDRNPAVKIVGSPDSTRRARP